MAQPDLKDLDMTVDFILRQTLSVSGGKGLPVKHLAFLKDIWSLFCMWRFGGYHLDCGCYPSHGTMDFSEPTTFGLVADTTVNGMTGYPHSKVKFQTGKEVCASLRTGLGVFENVVLKGQTKNKGVHNLKNIDVWLLRSPQGDKAAKIALEFYVKGWFEIKSKNLSDELRAQALRELIISAVATAVTHSGPKSSGHDAKLWDTHFIDASFSPGYVKSVNVSKVGFASHQ